MALWQWSTTPANNASAGSINWAEGQAPSTVNDSARQMMADVAADLMADREWLKFGDTPTYVSGTQFTVPGNLTSRYTIGRRVRAFVTAGTVYGTISQSAFSSNTTVTVVWDSGNLDSGLSEIDVGISNGVNTSVPAINGSHTSIGYDAGGANFRAISGNYGVIFRNDGTNFYMLQTASGSPYGSFNSYRPIAWSFSTGAVTIDGTGAGTSFGGQVSVFSNLIAGGNVTANSDERLKTDWEALPTDFVERLAAVKSGTYARVDKDLRQVGVGAQSLQPLMPEAVIENENGVLSVAYGQAALAACVELAKEVVRLRALLEPVK
jgi:hypothetical protein